MRETENEIMEMIKKGEFADRYKKVKITYIIGENYTGAYVKNRVGCRGIVVKDNNILITHELNSGWHLIPGGGVEKGETPEETKRGLVPEWIDIDKLYSVFCNHDDYYGIDEEKRGSYLREFTALDEYIKSTRSDRQNGKA